MVFIFKPRPYRAGNPYTTSLDSNALQVPCSPSRRGQERPTARVMGRKSEVVSMGGNLKAAAAVVLNNCLIICEKFRGEVSKCAMKSNFNKIC